jgi:hypothetical protein
MKPIYFKNRLTGEQFICYNTKNDKQIIDGVEFLIVRKNEASRPFLMRKDALQKVEQTKQLR